MTCVDGAATPRKVDVRACRIPHAHLSPERPAKRIVHDLDGIDQPVDPHRLLITGSALWGAWLDHRPGVVPELLIGLGTTSIIPTIAASIASGLPYILAWPFDSESDVASGSGRGMFPAAGRIQGKRVLVVDDHVIHGYTAASFISTLRDEAADVVGVLCLIEDAEGSGRWRVESTGVPLCAVHTL